MKILKIITGIITIVLTIATVVKRIGEHAFRNDMEALKKAVEEGRV